jgi:hypothetical protein
MIDLALATSFLVEARIRQCNGRGVPACLVHRGEAERGAILLILDRRDQGCELWVQTRDMQGALGWMRAQPDRMLTSLDARDYTERALARDPDLWVVEIEDPAGVNPFEGTAIG